MLKKNSRLTTKEVASVFKGAHRVSEKDITILFKENGKKINRYAVSIPSKTIGKAVIRNRIKRAVYNFISARKIETDTNKDFVLVIKKDFSKSKEDILINELDGVVSKIN